MELLLANPRGFCAGVVRAIDTVETLLDHGGPVHVRHEIVHNRRVVDRLSARGAIFVDRTEDIPEGALTVLSAHGVAPSVMAEAQARRLELVDATCPLVTKVHLEVARQARAGRSVVVIGHRGHVEVDGLIGHFPADAPGVIVVIEREEEIDAIELPDPRAVAWVTQTTLASGEARRIVEHLRARFPDLADPRGETICYATQNRQDTVRLIARDCDLVLVLGASHSSNSNRLVEVARESGARAILIEGAEDLRPSLFEGIARVGLTASASAPEDLVEAVIAWLGAHDPSLHVTQIGTPEDVHFNLPRAIRTLREETLVMEEKPVNDPVTGAKPRDGGVSDTIDDLLDSAADLAARLRDTAEDVGEFAGDQVGRLVKTAAELRDKTLSDKFLGEARQRPFLRSLRTSAHSALDVGFDLASVAVEAGLDGVDLLLRRKETPKPAPGQGQHRFQRPCLPDF